MTDNLVVNSSGQLELEKPKFSGQKPGRPIELKDIQFIDNRGSSTPATREKTFNISSALSASEGTQQSHEHSQTWSVEGTLAGNIGVTPPEDKGGVGAGGSAELKAGFVDSVVDSLQNAYSKQVEKVWSKSSTDTFNIPAKALYIMEAAWCVNVEEGTISYNGEQTTYSVVSEANEPDITLTAFETKADYDKAKKDRPDLWTWLDSHKLIPADMK